MGHSLPCCAPADEAQRTRATVKTLPVNVRQTLLMVVSPPWWYRIASNRARAPNALDRARRPVKGNPLSFLPAFNAEFGRPPADPASAFVPLGRVDLDQILCVEDERTVGRDNVVTADRVPLQLAKQPGRRTCAGLRVLVRRHLSGQHSVWYGARCLGRYDPTGQPLRAA